MAVARVVLIQAIGVAASPSPLGSQCRLGSPRLTSAVPMLGRVTVKPQYAMLARRHAALLQYRMILSAAGRTNPRGGAPSKSTIRSGIPSRSCRMGKLRVGDRGTERPSADVHAANSRPTENIAVCFNDPPSSKLFDEIA